MNAATERLTILLFARCNVLDMPIRPSHEPQWN